MAIVPTYDRKIITTAPLRPAQLDQVSPDAFGAGLGRDIQRASGIVQNQILEPAWQEANQARTNDALLQVGKKRRELAQKLKDAKGEQSMVVGDQVAKEFAAFRDETRGKLANDAQRAAFDPQAGHLGLGLDEQIGAHVDGQMRVVAQERTSGLIDLHGKNAVDNRHDHALAIGDLDQATTTFENYAKTQGMPQEAINAQKAKLRSEYLSQIIGSHLADNNAAAAKQWFTQHQTELEPAQRNSLSKALDVEDLRGQSQAKADQIMAYNLDKFKDPATGQHNGDWAATTDSAMAAVQNIADPKLRDETQARVEHALAVQQKMASDRQSQNFNTAYDLANQPGSTMDSIPATIMSTMDAGQKERLRRFIENRPVDQTTSDKTWLDFNGMVSADGGRELANMDQATLATTYKPNLEPAKWERVVSVWAAAREAAQKPQKAAELDSFMTAHDRFNDALASAKIDPKNDPDSAAALKRSVDREIQTQSAAKGRKLDPAETQSAIDAVFLRKVMVTKKTFGMDWAAADERKIAGMLTADEKGNAYVPFAEIPLPHVTYLRGIYPKATDDQMQRAYAAYLMGDRNRSDAIMREGK